MLATYSPTRGVTIKVIPTKEECERVLTPRWLSYRNRWNLWFPTPERLEQLGIEGVDIEDFKRRFILAEVIKTEMRRQYARSVLQGHVRDTNDWLARRYGLPVEPREVFLARSREFWEAYEQVNRDLIPEDPVYSGALLGTTASTAAIWGEYKPGANGQGRILESYFGGEQTSSTVQRIGVYLATTAGTTPTAGTLNKLNTRSQAAAGAFNTAYSTQPTLSAQPMVVHAFNSFGGTDRWVPQPGEEIYSLGAGTAGEPIDWQPKAGTSVMSSHQMTEEL